MEKLIDIGTDVAHLLLFHPDDLEHRQSDPVAWYGYDFAYRPESAAGRLIAWGTGADGGYRVRLTTDGLTADEERHACAPWTFPLVVRHGRVLLDNTDALPGEAQMSEPDEDAAEWFELANGAYRVSVHPIDRTATEADGLADYVLIFEAVETITGITVSDTPPRLQPFKSSQQQPAPSLEAGSRFDWPQEPLPGDTFPALAAAAGTVILPGLDESLPIAEDVVERLMPQKRPGRDTWLVLAQDLEPGALGVAAWVNGKSWMKGAGHRIAVLGQALVRILAVEADPTLSQVRVEPIGKPDMSADPAALAGLRAQLVERARKDAAFSVRSFDIERLETLTSPEAVTGWALAQLPIPLGQRLALYASPADERIAGISQWLREAHGG